MDFIDLTPNPGVLFDQFFSSLKYDIHSIQRLDVDAERTVRVYIFNFVMCLNLVIGTTRTGENAADWPQLLKLVEELNVHLATVAEHHDQVQNMQLECDHEHQKTVRVVRCKDCGADVYNY